MTTERAKAELEQIYGILSSEKQQALDMAIQALEQEPFEDDNEDCDYGYDENNAYDSYRDRYYDREYAESGE